MQDAMAVVVNKIHERFQDSLVLTRAFLTLPFQSLPARQREFASSVARSVELEGLLNPHTPVHSLMATRGCVPEWNVSSASRGHLAIPLLSEAFVASIPMMSRLLKELGLPLTWVNDPGSALVRQVIGSEVGFFYVGDAAGATDEQGRRIIAAQDFVRDYGVRTVFAVGGAIFGESVFVLIFFSRDSVESRRVRVFMPMINLLKSVVVLRYSVARLFKPEDL
jgi:hypothetical protein